MFLWQQQQDNNGEKKEKEEGWEEEEYTHTTSELIVLSLKYILTEWETEKQRDWKLAMMMNVKIRGEWN